LENSAYPTGVFERDFLVMCSMDMALQLVW